MSYGRPPTPLICNILLFLLSLIRAWQRMSPQLTLSASPKCYRCSRIDCSTFFLPSIISLNGITVPLLKMLHLTQHPSTIKYVFIPYNFIASNGSVLMGCYEVLTTTVLSDGHSNGRGSKNEDSNSNFSVGWDGVAKRITKCSSYHHEILASRKNLSWSRLGIAVYGGQGREERLTKGPRPMNHVCQITLWQR